VAGGVRVDVETLSGQAAEELPALARRIEALLTVVGSGGRDAVKAATRCADSGSRSARHSPETTVGRFRVVHLCPPSALSSRATLGGAVGRAIGCGRARNALA
jgi:hypothetical protein